MYILFTKTAIDANYCQHFGNRFYGTGNGVNSRGF